MDRRGVLVPLSAETGRRRCIRRIYGRRTTPTVVELVLVVHQAQDLGIRSPIRVDLVRHMQEMCFIPHLGRPLSRLMQGLSRLLRRMQEMWSRVDRPGRCVSRAVRRSLIRRARRVSRAVEGPLSAGRGALAARPLGEPRSLFSAGR